MSPIKLYWWRGEGADDPSRRNFGDYLSPLLVEMLASRSVLYAPPEKADLFAIGTILKRERKARNWFLPRRLHIWGSGAGDASESFSSHHHYHAVRGSFTRSLIQAGFSGAPVLGDPGLLVRAYWQGRPQSAKAHTLGVIPHYVDKDAPAIKQLLTLPGSRLIDVFAPIDEILREVQSCEFVISTSLHGLIVSDAFDVPNRRLIVSDLIKSTRKFADYYSAFGLTEPDPLTPQAISGHLSPEKLVGDYRKRDVDRICTELIAAFPKDLL